DTAPGHGRPPRPQPRAAAHFEPSSATGDSGYPSSTFTRRAGGRRSPGPHDLGGERLERLPVIRAFAQGDAEPGAAERAELVHHPVRVLHHPAQIAGAV